MAAEVFDDDETVAGRRPKSSRVALEMVELHGRMERADRKEGTMLVGNVSEPGCWVGVGPRSGAAIL